MGLVKADGVGFEVWQPPRAAVSDAVVGAPGGRPVVVGLHGLVLDDLSGFYFTLGGALSEVAELVLYDLRGHGRSEFVETGYSVAGMTDDLFALLDTLGHTGPVHLLANSYGGAIAVTAALTRPGRVASIIMIEGHYPLAGWGAEMESTLALVASRLNPEHVMHEMQITSRRKAERLAARADLLINQSTLRKELLDEPVVGPEDLSRVTCPVLCCYGSASDLAARGRALADALANAELHEYEGATHSLLTERMHELRPLVRDWVAGRATARADRAGRSARS